MKVIAMWDDILCVYKIVMANNFEKVVKVFNGFAYSKNVPEIIKNEIEQISTMRKENKDVSIFFAEWADSYFNAEKLNRFLNKKEMISDVHLHPGLCLLSANKFKKLLMSYCEEKDFVLNPKALKKQSGRIIKTVSGKSVEMIFIQTKPILL